jgi:hypothetical protein
MSFGSGSGLIREEIGNNLILCFEIVLFVKKSSCFMFIIVVLVLYTVEIKNVCEGIIKCLSKIGPNLIRIRIPSFLKSRLRMQDPDPEAISGFGFETNPLGSCRLVEKYLYWSPAAFRLRLRRKGRNCRLCESRPFLWLHK